MKAVIYSRYSSDLQREASIEDQERACRAFGQSHGLEITASYSDKGISGASLLQRPEAIELLAAARRREFDVVLCESLDRLSRNQRDIADIYQNLAFSDVKILTMSEGEVSEMHIGLKGTMNALFLKDLKIKVKRGMVGRIKAGKAAGNLCYGYDLVKGEERGEWAINPEHADIVRRICQDYANGKNVKAITKSLNAEGVPAPKGGHWCQSAINGNRKRASGILENPIYIGQRIYNRQSFVKDPMTGRTVGRINPTEEWVYQDVPELAIVAPDIWAKIRKRKAKVKSKSYRSTRYLISGLIKCGKCGGPYTSVGAGRMRCSYYSGRGTCDNTASAKIEVMEDRILASVSKHLTDADYLDDYISAYREEWALLSGDRDKERRQLGTQKAGVERKINNLLRLIENGQGGDAIGDRLNEREAELKSIEAKIAEVSLSQPIEHRPADLADKWANDIKSIKSLMSRDIAQASSQLTAIIDKVIFKPIKRGHFDLEIVGSIGEALPLPRTPRFPPHNPIARAGLPRSTFSPNDFSLAQLDVEFDLVCGRIENLL